MPPIPGSDHFESHSIEIAPAGHVGVENDKKRKQNQDDIMNTEKKSKSKINAPIIEPMEDLLTPFAVEPNLDLPSLSPESNTEVITENAPIVNGANKEDGYKKSKKTESRSKTKIKLTHIYPDFDNVKSKEVRMHREPTHTAPQVKLSDENMTVFNGKV